MIAVSRGDAGKLCLVKFSKAFKDSFKCSFCVVKITSSSFNKDVLIISVSPVIIILLPFLVIYQYG